jgi:hypothetical protein
MLNGASKNLSFRTDFKNLHMTLVKSAPKKSFCQKTILPIENWKKWPQKYFFHNILKWGSKNPEFDADFKSVEKNVKKFLH